MRDYTYTLDKVVIGSRLSAAAYSYMQGVPIIINSNKSPFRFDYINPEIELDKIGLKNITGELNTPDGVKVVGLSELDAWRYTIYMLSLGGLCSLVDKVEAIRVDGHQVVTTFRSSNVVRINFENHIAMFFNVANPLRKQV